MSGSDHTEPGKYGRSRYARWLCKHYNRVMRHEARQKLRKGIESAPEQTRHRALWDAF